MARVLMIDNFDSFTHNLVDEFEKRGCQVRVYRNSTPLERIRAVVKEFRPGLIVVSPGPGTPGGAGNSIKIIRAYKGALPIFGVCLGLQCAAEAFGGSVGKAPETLHGKRSSIAHDGKTIFRGIENPFSAGRYHSLCALKPPKGFIVSARSETGTVMALRHRKYFIEGVQFHPESMLTPEGGKIIENLIGMAAGGQTKK